MIIEYDVFRVGPTVLGIQIINQASSLCYAEIGTTDGVSIQSSTCPEIQTYDFFIRGSDEDKDLDLTFKYFDSLEDRERYLHAIKTTFIAATEEYDPDQSAIYRDPLPIGRCLFSNDVLQVQIVSIGDTCFMNLLNLKERYHSPARDFGTVDSEDFYLASDTVYLPNGYKRHASVLGSSKTDMSLKRTLKVLSNTYRLTPEGSWRAPYVSEPGFPEVSHERIQI